MKVIIISGFLGSGKTSLISFAANALAANGTRTAVIENEISPSGLDGKLLEKSGLHVRELVSGCICCKLQGELSGALEEIAQEYKPEVLFIEPTGAAAPVQVKEAVENSPCVDETIMLVILDAKRLAGQKLEQYPFVAQSVRNADLVVVNKIDLVQTENIESISICAKKLNLSAEIIPLSLGKGKNLKELSEKLKILKKCSPYIKTDINPLIKSHPVSSSLSNFLSGKINSRDIERRIDKKLNDLTVELLNAGCSMVGHIKVLVENGENFIFFSRTSFSGENSKKYFCNDTDVSDWKVTISAIIYGLSENILESMIEKHFG